MQGVGDQNLWAGILVQLCYSVHWHSLEESDNWKNTEVKAPPKVWVLIQLWVCLHCDLGNGLNSLCLSVLCYTAMTVLPGIMWGVVRWHQLMSGGSKGSMCTTFHPQPGLSSQKEKEDAELTFNVAMDIIDSGFLWHCLLLRNSDMLDLCGCQLQFLNLDFYQKFPVLTETDIRKELLSNNGRFSIWLQAPSVVFFIPECRGFQGFWSSTEL